MRILWYFLSAQLITCFIDILPLKIKSQSVVYLRSGSEHIYWILDLEGEVHSIWVIWTSGLQECKGKLFRSRAGQGPMFGQDLKFRICFGTARGRRPWAPSPIHLLWQFVGGGLASADTLELAMKLSLFQLSKTKIQIALEHAFNVSLYELCVSTLAMVNCVTGCGMLSLP